MARRSCCAHTMKRWIERHREKIIYLLFAGLLLLLIF
jgi:hypothetical protein